MATPAWRRRDSYSEAANDRAEATRRLQEVHTIYSAFMIISMTVYAANSTRSHSHIVPNSSTRSACQHWHVLRKVPTDCLHLTAAVLLFALPDVDSRPV